MPSYPVEKPGFYNGVYYHPEERNVLVTSKAFDKKTKPSWVGKAVKQKEEIDFNSPNTVDAAENNSVTSNGKVMNESSTVVNL